MSKIDNPEVARVFDGYPEPMRKKTMRLWQLVLDTASKPRASTRRRKP